MSRATRREAYLTAFLRVTYARAGSIADQTFAAEMQASCERHWQAASWAVRRACTLRIVAVLKRRVLPVLAKVRPEEINCPEQDDGWRWMRYQNAVRRRLGMPSVRAPKRLEEVARRWNFGTLVEAELELDKRFF